MNKPRRVALYVRVSTTDQNSENQERDLRSWADRCGHEVVAVFRDDGVSGAKGRDQRPGLDAMLKAVARRNVNMVAAWSVDRLGRSMVDLLTTLQEIHGAGAELYLDRQAIDTTTPSGKAMFQMMGVFAEFERSVITDRVNAGIARAQAAGVHCGRPKVSPEVEAKARELLAQGIGKRKAAGMLGVGVATIQRIAQRARLVA